MNFNKGKGKMPVMMVGKYAGTPIDKLPVSYLRWMITQDFPKEWLDIANEKVKKSMTSNHAVNLRTHAIDTFSMRFLNIWQKEVRAGEKIGLGTFIAREAERAWNEGEDVSKNRYKGDGKIKEWLGLRWVFGHNEAYPDYKDLITIMEGTLDEDEEDYCGMCSRPLYACKCQDD